MPSFVTTRITTSHVLATAVVSKALPKAPSSATLTMTLEVVHLRLKLIWWAHVPRSSQNSLAQGLTDQTKGIGKSTKKQFLCPVLGLTSMLGSIAVSRSPGFLCEVLKWSFFALHGASMAMPTRLTSLLRVKLNL